MKKLLLLSLLTLSATSFANVFQGEEKFVTAPISVKGQVVDTANSKLIIETESSAGTDAGTIAFDFGKIDNKVETTINRFVKFKVRKGNNTPFTASEETITVGLLNGASGVVNKVETAMDSYLGSGGKIVYTVASQAEAANTTASTGPSVINGTLTVDVQVKSGAVAGNFLDVGKELVAFIPGAPE